MEVIQKIVGAKEEVKSTLFYKIKLLRNNIDLGALKEKLNSYICEPRTYSLYERFYVLNNKLNSLIKRNTLSVVNLDKSEFIATEDLDKIKNQILEYSTLQKDICSYMREASHCS